MVITLNLEGKERTFSLGFIPSRMLRQTFEMQKKMKQIDENVLDEAIDYVVDVFGKQFTRDDLYNGVDAADLFPLIIGCINEVSSRTTKAIGADKADPN